MGFKLNTQNYTIISIRILMINLTQVHKFTLITRIIFITIIKSLKKLTSLNKIDISIVNLNTSTRFLRV